jgi:hypothetical protein
MNCGVLLICLFVAFFVQLLPWWAAFPTGCAFGGVYAILWRVLVRPRVDSYYAWKQNAVPLNEDHPDWGKK